MKRLQGGKVVDYNPWDEPIQAEKPEKGNQTFEAPTSMGPTTTTVVPDGSISDVLKWVGNNPDRATAALKVELAKDAPRSTLIDKLS